MYDSGSYPDPGWDYSGLNNPNDKPQKVTPGYEWIWNGTSWEQRPMQAVPGGDINDKLPIDEGGGGGGTGGGATGGKTPEQIEAEGRAYDAAHGYIGGYMMNGVWVNGSPHGGGGGGGGSYGGGGGYGGEFGAGLSEGFGGGDYGEVPGFDAPRWTAPPEFTYGKQFQSPDAASLQADPSYQFRLDQGRKALEQSAAGKGVLRTGGTLKDLVNYGQNFATNEYSNVYNRKFNEYKFDYDKEADIYARNYNLKRDVFDRNYKAAYDEYSPKLTGWTTNTNNRARQQEALFNREYQMYLANIEHQDRVREQEWRESHPNG